MSANDFDDVPDGAWFATLETAAQEFIDKFKLPSYVNNNSAAHQYLRMKSGREQQKHSGSDESSGADRAVSQRPVQEHL